MLARPVFVLLALATLFAGCVSPSASNVKTSSVTDPAVATPLAFFTKTIDSTRAGGEPVIQITQKGTILVAAHPGWTHTRYPPSPNLVTPATGQSYLWRSTDNGSTWAPIGLPMANGMGPRGLGQGVSDPDFTMDSKGRVYLTDLEALASASVSWSDDDGATWLEGNDIAYSFGGAPIDRNWLASHGTDVYAMGNYGSENVIKSTDGGLTWSKIGSSPCEEQFTTDAAGDVVVACPTGIAVMEKGKSTFEKRDVPGATTKIRAMAAPAFDEAGNVYVPWANESGVWLAGSPDLGKTWWPPVLVSEPLFPAHTGTHVWPYVVAGDAGRVGVAWYGTSASGGPAQAKGDWFVYEATVLGADTATPQLYATKVTEKPIFQGGICQGGTGCQADPTPAGDRRLGDFFEAAVDATGHLDVVYAIATTDSISHPGFARQTAGPLLVEGK